MAKKKLHTSLVFVQDETGSMLDGRDATVSAFNEYFHSLQADGGKLGKVDVSVWQFSDAAGEERVRSWYKGALADVPQLADEYAPRGVTPLFDAVGTALQQTEQIKADRYLFIVQTDGLENASRDFHRDQVAAMIKEKEEADNWTLVFLGAGINNWAQEAMAMRANYVSTYTTASPRATGSAGPSGSMGSLGQTSASFLRSNLTSNKNLAQDTQRVYNKKVDKAKKKAKPKS